jgi:hypothetical protein
VASVKSGGSGREGIHKTIIEARRQTAASISSQAYKEESLEVVARCGRGKKKMIVDRRFVDERPCGEGEQGSGRELHPRLLFTRGASRTRSGRS